MRSILCSEAAPLFCVPVCLSRHACDFSREGGAIGLFITPVPKVLNNVFYSMSLHIWGILLNFD